MNSSKLYILQDFTYACMHRDMQSNTPLRFYEFARHLEILNAGGLYGNARPENFPSVNDYRNPLVASAMKTLGYVNMFNRGVGQVQTDLKENGNPPAEFNVNLITAFKVDVKVSQSYTKENGGKNDGKKEGNVPVIELTERQRVILELVSTDSTLSAKALSEKMSEKMSKKNSVNERTIERDIAKLKKLDYLRRIGGRKDGHWEVNIPLNSVVEIV